MLKLNLNIFDYIEELTLVIKNSDNYSEYLKNIGKLLKLFTNKFNINFKNIEAEQFKKYKDFLNKFDYKKFRNKIYFYLKNSKNDIEKAINIINKFFKNPINDCYFQEGNFSETPENILPEIIDINVIFLLMGNFNASTSLNDNNLIFFSIDNFNQEEFKSLFLHEIAHVISNYYITGLNMNNNLKLFYSEGLSMYITKKILNLDTQQVFNLNFENLNKYIKNINQLKLYLNKYLQSNYFYLKQGIYHKYFKKLYIPDPFIAYENEFSRYGYLISLSNIEEYFNNNRIGLDIF